GLLVRPFHRLSRSLHRHAHRARQGIHLAHRLRLLHSSRIGGQVIMKLISRLSLSRAALASLLPSGLAQPVKAAKPVKGEYIAYVGTYTGANQSKGIYAWRFH